MEGVTEAAEAFLEQSERVQAAYHAVLTSMEVAGAALTTFSTRVVGRNFCTATLQEALNSYSNTVHVEDMHPALLAAGNGMHAAEAGRQAALQAMHVAKAQLVEAMDAMRAADAVLQQQLARARAEVAAGVYGPKEDPTAVLDDLAPLHVQAIEEEEAARHVLECAAFKMLKDACEEPAQPLEWP
jgi:hypothetical protein